jgi:hypothetical protein
MPENAQLPCSMSGTGEKKSYKSINRAHLLHRVLPHGRSLVDTSTASAKLPKILAVFSLD